MLQCDHTLINCGKYEQCELWRAGGRKDEEVGSPSTAGGESHRQIDGADSTDSQGDKAKAWREWQ